MIWGVIGRWIVLMGLAMNELIGIESSMDEVVMVELMRVVRCYGDVYG